MNQIVIRTSIARMRRLSLGVVYTLTSLVAWVGLDLVATECSADGDAEKLQNRPNILFIMSDDHGYQAISAYGSKVNQTPNIDRLAKDGMRFDRCFVTNSICGPARAVILTGKYSHLNGFVQNGNRFNGEQQTVAKLLQHAGYNTAVVGKWHLETDPTGFDYWEILQGQGPYYNPVMLTAEGQVRHEGYTTDIITDLALDWLQTKRNPGKPFYLVYQHKAPHRNWQPGPKYLNKYDGVDIPEPETLFDDYSGRGTAAHTQEMTVAKHLNSHDLKLTDQGARFTPEQRAAWDAAYGEKNRAFEAANLQGDDLIRWKYQRYAKDYLRCIDSVDENVGRVLDYLDESGLADNTIVFYTSDQGWYLGEHGWYDKRWMYEESFRTPLIVRWPGHTKPGATNKDLVMNLDFAETFLDVAGIAIPDDMQGRSLKPILEGETPDDWRTSVYYHYYEFPGPHSVRRHYGVRTDRYKLIYFYEIGEWELYDLQEDPHELQSVYDDPKYREIVDTMKKELERLREQYQDDDTVVDFNAEQAKNVKPTQVLGFAEHEPIAIGGEVVMEKPSSEIDPAYKPMLVGSWCQLETGDGVLLAQGGGGMGYSIYFKEGVPYFAVRANGQVQTIHGEAIPLGAWTHVAAKLDANGLGRLMINGYPACELQKMGWVNGRPSEGLSIGEDTNSSVSGETDLPGFTGAIRDLRIYWGEPNSSVLESWSRDADTRILFDGLSLDGWQVLDEFDFAKSGNVEVDDGVIRLGRGQPATGIRCLTGSPKTDYEVALEAQRIEGSDFFCGLTAPVRDEFITLIIGGWGGGVTGISNLDGMSAIENETTGFQKFENNRWYTIRLRVTDDRIQAWVDHEQIVGITTSKHKYSIWWEQEPARPLGIVSWNTAAELRNIRLTDLGRVESP